MSLNTPLNPRKASASARFRLVDTIISRYGEADNKSGGQVLPANMYTQQRHAKNNSFAVTNYSQNAGQEGLSGTCSTNNLKSGTTANAQENLDIHGLPRGQYAAQQLYAFPNGSLYPGSAQAAFSQQAPGGDHNAGVQYLPATMVPGFVGNTNIGNSSMTAYAWPSYLHAENPGLDPNRRSSWSSVEDNGPPTPAGVGVANHHDVWTPMGGLHKSSMVGLPAYYTPLASFPNVYQPGAMQFFRNPDTNEYETRNFDEWTSQAPAIPRAVPALWTNNDNMTLAKCLQNTEGITNVYIRGFLPETNDDMLRGYAARFGDIDSCKAIIDMDANPPKCKGYGFVKYFHPADAENCIRGFYHLGYQASYAQKSRNSRLKDLEDKSSTNVYCTGVPISWNESDLHEHFLPKYPAVSEKIVRAEDTGVSNGVGFARFESREIAEKVLADFHMVPGKDGVKLSLRFADTKAQKDLKAQSNKCRQHRKNEYEFGVEHYDSASPSPAATRFSQAYTHVSPASQVSYHSPAAMSNNFTPATSVSPPNMEDVTKSMKGVSVTSWPIQGGLTSITNTPSYRPGYRPAARNAFADYLSTPAAAKERTTAGTDGKKEETPSPQKVMIKTEISTDGKSPVSLRRDNVLATPGSVH